MVEVSYISMASVSGVEDIIYNSSVGIILEHSCPPVQVNLISAYRNNSFPALF